MKIRVRLLRNFFAKEPGRHAPVNAPDQFAQHIAVGNWMIAQHLLAAEAVLLGREVRRCPFPVQQLIKCRVRDEPGHAALMRDEIAHRDLVLAALRERGPIAADRFVELDPPAINQHQHRHQQHDLGNGGHRNDGVPLPTPCLFRIRPPAPQINDHAAAPGHTQRSADLQPLVEVGNKCITQRMKSLVAKAVHLNAHNC